jgi:hypothetical protein
MDVVYRVAMTCANTPGVGWTIVPSGVHERHRAQVDFVSYDGRFILGSVADV